MTWQKIIIGGVVLSSPLWANSYHLKLLSDTTPDLSSIEAFGYDIGHNWEQNNEKAIVLGYWLGRLTKYGSPLYFSRQWDDPIAFLNNNSYGMCSDMTLLLNAMGEGAYGFKGRHHELNRLDHPLSHTVPEIEYDNALHFIDPSYGLAYCHYDNGVITSMRDAALNPYFTQHNLPSALTRDSDGEGEIKAWMSYGRKDRTSEKLHHGEYNPSQTWIEKKTEGYYGVHTFDINLQEDQFYTRYWHHLEGLAGFGTHDFFWPHYNFKVRDDFSWNENAAGEHRSNGLWGYHPQLNNASSYEASHGIQSMDDHLYPATLGEEGWVTFKVDAANFITGAILDADITRRDLNDQVVIEASSSGGNQWFPIWQSASVGTHITIHENISAMLRGTLSTQDLRHVTDYRVRVRLRALGDIHDAALNDLKLSTVTVLNKNALPKLELGSNEILIAKSRESSDQTSRFNPVLAKQNHGTNGAISWQDQEVWTLYTQDHHNVTAASNRGNLYTGLWKTTSRLGWVTYAMDAPRAIKKARLGGSFIVRENSSDQFSVLYRLFDGAWSEWIPVASYDWSSRNNGDARENQTHLEEWEIAQEGVSRIEFRVEMLGYPHIEALHMEIDYAAKQTLDRPLEVTYSWTEYHEDAQGDLPSDANGGMTRTHRERITALPHRFVINTAGNIQPRMNWVSMNVEGSADPMNVAPLGYSDGVEGSNEAFIPMLNYDIGELISIGRSITASTAPSSGALDQLLDGKITSSEDNQHTNQEEIVTFAQGVGAVEFVIDLGSVQSVGGVRVDSYLENPTSSSFPESIVVEAQVGDHYQAVGHDAYQSAKYPHNLYPMAWSIPEHAYAPSRGRFPTYGRYSNYTFIPFKEEVETRYIKVKVAEQVLRGHAEGFALGEIHVYDHLVSHEWSPKLAHASAILPPVERDQPITLDAKEATLSSPMERYEDAHAFEGYYLSTPQHYQGEATYTFEVPSEGEYLLWGRYIALDGGKNSFFLQMDEEPEVIWDLNPLSNAWRWSQISGRGLGLLRYHLTAGEHHLRIRGRERLSALDRLILTSDETFVPSNEVDSNPDEEDAVVYEDAEDGTTQGWSIFSNSSGEAVIHNVWDETLKSRVIALEGGGKGDGYMLGNRRGEGAWNDQRHNALQWRMNYHEPFTIYVSLETTYGRRYLTYSEREESIGLHGSYIGIGLGSGSMNGAWQTVRRNLTQDLHQFEEDNQIVSINAFMVRGSGRLDDIVTFSQK